MAKERSPNEIEVSLRRNAEKLAADFVAAREAGFVVLWPTRPDGLASIEISAAGTVADDGEQAAELTPLPAADRPAVAAGTKA